MASGWAHSHAVPPTMVPGAMRFSGRRLSTRRIRCRHGFVLVVFVHQAQVLGWLAALSALRTATSRLSMTLWLTAVMPTFLYVPAASVMS